MLGAMFDSRTYHAHVLPVRPAYDTFVLRSADPQVADRGTAFIATVDDPQPARAPSVAWAVDGNAVALESTAPSSDATAYALPLRGGATTLHAYLGPPVNREVDTPIFAYRSFFLGCAKRLVPIGVSFETDGSAVARTSQDGSDLFARGTACATPRRTALALVAPRGATYVATRALADFAAVSTRAWQPGGPTSFGFATYGTILERLRDGRMLKIFLGPGARTTVDAPYTIAAANDEFDDVRFRASAAQTTERGLPASVRVPSGTPPPESEDGPS